MATKPSKTVSIDIMTSDDYDRANDPEGVILTIYGEEGVGKTYSLANMPVTSTLVIGFDTGVKVLKRMKLGHRLIQIRDDLSNIDAVMEMIVSDDESSDLYKKRQEMFPDGIKFVVIDHMTAMFNFLTNAFADRRNHFIRTLKDAGDANAAMNRYISRFRSLADHGINIVFLALELPYEIGSTIGEDPRPITKIMPAIGGKPAIPTHLVGISDVVGRFVHDTTKDTRAIRLFGNVSEKISCKSRFTEGISEYPHLEWEEADIFKIICKSHSINPEKALAKVSKENETERARLKETRGQRATVRVDMSNTTMANSVTGSTNESKKKNGRNSDDNDEMEIPK